MLLALAASPVQAGNEANFVLYNQNVAEKGEVEIEVLSDLSNVGGEEPNYTAQVFELEYGLTDRWTTSLYFEGNKENGEDYQFGGWRFENRVRVFKGNVFLNPVLYAEYEQLQQPITNTCSRLSDARAETRTKKTVRNMSWRPGLSSVKMSAIG